VLLGAALVTSSSSSRPIAAALQIATLLAIGVGAWLGLHSTEPPADDRGGFSTARALAHLEAIAQAPRPIGSVEHDRVRDYVVGALRQLGLETDVQQAQVAWNDGRRVRAARVENIVATIPGTDPRRGIVLLVAHYDSTTSGSGAADNGAAVAALLEVARVVALSPRNAASVAVLFTDGEERGLLGARAFVDAHPMFARVEVVLNFDARGSSGGSMMFESSPHNLELVRALGNSGAPVFAASYTQAVYRSLDNDTDFSVFRAAGTPGLNFAFFANPGTYHAPSDSIAELATSSLRHHGAYALALGRSLAAERSPASGDDAVYFTVPAIGLVAYSTTFALALGVLAVALTLGAWIVGLRARRIEIAGLLKASVLAVSITTATVAIGSLLLVVATRLAGGADLVRWEQLDMATVGVVLVLLGTCCAAVRIALRWVSPLELVAGALFLLSGLALWTSVAMPGASYLVTLPAIGAATA
jgi:hypothetical protein